MVATIPARTGCLYPVAAAQPTVGGAIGGIQGVAGSNVRRSLVVPRSGHRGSLNAPSDVRPTKDAR